LKACTLVYRTTEAKTVIIFSSPIDGTMKQIVHMLQTSISHLIKVKTINQVDNTYHLKAPNVTYRNTEFQIVLYSKDRTTKKSMHAEKIYKLPLILLEKTAVKLDQTGQ
jgi:hypothetical protein